MSINVNVGNFIPTNVVEVGNEISADQLAAITSANSPSGLNPFSTASHIHTIANVSGLQTTLDGKAGISHTHTISSISDLQTALDGKASVAHTHTIGNITGLPEALSLKSDTSHLHDGVYSPVSHTHTIANITGLQTALDGKASSSHTHTEYALLTGATFSGNIVRDNGLGQSIIGPASLSFSQTGGGGSFVAYESTRIVFADASIQSTASYSKAQSDAHLTTVAGWVDTKASKSGDIFTGKVDFTPVNGVAGLNIGIGGTSTDSITAGDLWISTGGANLNFRDGTGAWRIVASTSNTNAFSAPQIIDTTATSAGLRITQKGTGHSLIVEDSTTPDSSAVVITNNGAIGVGVDPYAGPFAGDASLVVQMNDKQRAASFRRTGSTTNNGHPVVWISGFNGTYDTVALQVVSGIVDFQDAPLRIGPFGNTTRATISNIQQPVIATGTYNREIAITMDGATYRIPCRQV